jgi:hypothetical protein
MAENILKEPKKENETKSDSKKSGMFNSILNGSVLTETSADLLPFVFFLAMLAAMLIANTYYAEKKVRQIEQMRGQVTELRTIYIYNKSDLMYISNQSEIARRLHDQGFVESTVPPKMLLPGRRKTSFMLRITGRN